MERISILHDTETLQKKLLQCLGGPKSNPLMKTGHRICDGIAAAPAGCGYTEPFKYLGTSLEVAARIPTRSNSQAEKCLLSTPIRQPDTLPHLTK